MTVTRTTLRIVGTCMLAATLCAAIAARGRADEQADLSQAMGRADAAIDKADYAEAVRQLERALALAPAVYGADAERTAGIQHNLGLAYERLGDYAKALPPLQRSLKNYEARGADRPVVAASLNGLALLYFKMGQYAKAEPLYQRSLRIHEANYGVDHPQIVETANNLANLYRATGQYAQAEALFQRCLRIKEIQLGPDHAEVALVANNLAALYAVLGQYAKAEALFQRSLKIREAALGADHPDVAKSLNNLAGIYKNLGQFDKAEPLYQRSLKIRETRLDANHPDVAFALYNLALLYYGMGENETGQNAAARYAQAETLAARSLKIREAALGPDHANVADSLNLLGLVYETRGEHARAEPLYQRSLKIMRAALGPDHPDLAQSGLNSLACLHCAIDRFDAAREEFDEARRIIRRHAASVLPMLSDAEQIAFLKNTDQKYYHNALSLGWTRPRDQTLVNASAVWLANGKAVAQESLAQRAALARDGDDPQLKAVARQLVELRTQLANLANAAARPGQEAARLAELAELGQREQDLAHQLSRAGGAAAPPTWVELDAVRRNIPARGLLVDIVQFRPTNFKATRGEATWLPPHYVAWLTPAAGAGEVQVVDLGPADKIDLAVRRYQAAMAAAQTGKPVRELGEEQAAAELQKPLAELARLILQPLLPAIGDQEELILSPDAGLWLIPWGALPTGEKNQFALEKWKIHYLTSARDLAAEHKAASTRPPRVFANPNYDLAPTETPRVLAAIFGGAPLAPTQPSSIQPSSIQPSSIQATPGVGLDRGLRSAATIGRAAALPGTAEEAQAIMPHLQEFAGQPKLYAGPQALEGVFKRLAAPRVLVVSTHGFFLPDASQFNDAAQGGAAQGSAGDDGRGNPRKLDAAGAMENPLLRCGLLLAGCNQRERIADPNLDDGILTGMEIVGTNLRGTELVVLSACETGLGQVQNGEGVAGLRQAFQLAGAQAVVSTLWQIPDKETVQLMNEFFNNLAAGKSKPDALRDAQLNIIQARRKEFGAAHPLYWAAFTLTGQ